MVENKILIIDDDHRNIFALSAVLKAKGFQCISAIGAEEGLEILANDRDIVVVLMDMMMPGMDGYEAISKMKSSTQFKDIPVIAVTAQAMLGDKERCLNAGAVGYVAKPINVEELLKLLALYVLTE
jgi:two-component system cell cycle response regulator DivK